MSDGYIMLSCIVYLSLKKYKHAFSYFLSVCLYLDERDRSNHPAHLDTEEALGHMYVELHRDPGENNSSRLFLPCTKQLKGSVCVHIYVPVCASVPSCLLTCMSLCACARVIQKERYLIILCSPIQVIQMI